MTYCLVPKDELKELLYDSLRLQALDCGGVDAWQGYDWSINDFLEALKEDYNVPAKKSFDLDDVVEVDVEGYEMIER